MKLHCWSEEVNIYYRGDRDEGKPVSHRVKNEAPASHLAYSTSAWSQGVSSSVPSHCFCFGIAHLTPAELLPHLPRDRALPDFDKHVTSNLEKD